MNNIYKVIWSKAKNCYVVASEIARSHTKSASGSEKIGGVTRRSLLASLMALSLLCGGLGVASAADDVSVAESTAPGAVEVYTKTGVNTLLDGKANTSLDNLSDAGKAVIKTTMTDELAKKADATALDSKANTSLDNLSDAGKAVIKTTMTDELAKKADATALDGKANTSLDNLSDAGKSVIKTTMADELAKKADATALDGKANTSLDNLSEAGKSVIKDTMAGELAQKADKTALDGKANTNLDNLSEAGKSVIKGTMAGELTQKADKTDLEAATNRITANEGKITDLQKKTSKLSPDGTALTGMTTVSGTTVSGTNVEAGALKVIGEISNGAGVTTTLADIKDSMDQTGTNKTWIGRLKDKTTKITYDAALGTSVDGVTFNAGAVTGVKSINGTEIGTKESGEYIHQDNSIWGNMKKVDTQVKTNADAIAQEKTDRENAIGNLTEDKNYIKKDKNVSDNLVELDKQAKTNADAIAQEKTDRENAIGSLTEDKNYIKKDKNVSDNLVELDKQAKANADEIVKTNERTGGITRNTEKTQTTIEGSVKVDNQGNVKEVKGLSAETITTTGNADLKGNVILGTNTANTVTVNGNADFNEAVNMDKGLTVTSGDTTLKGTKVDGKLTVTDEADLKNTKVDGTLGVTGATTLSGELTAEKNATFKEDVTVKGTTNLKDTTVDGDLKVTGTITTDKMVFGDPATNNYTEIDHGKVTSKNLVVNGAGQTISSSSTFDVEKNEVGFTNTATGDHSYYKQTAKGINGYVTDKDGNKTYTKVTATENSFQVQDKDGKNKNHQVNTKDSSVTEITNGDGKTTKTEQTATDITNTAKDGTITNDGKNIVNVASENISNKSQTMDTTVTGKATESYGELDTTVNGKETHKVTGDQENTIGGNQTTTVEGNVKEDYKKDLTTTVGGNELHEVTGTKTENVTGKVTENYKAGQETNVTGDQDIYVTGKQTNIVESGQENIISGGQTNTITGGQINNITGDQTTTVTDGNISNTAKNITNAATETLTDKVGTNTRVTTSTSITDTVGTANRKIEDGKIIDTAGDSTVTTENGKGTTFAKTTSAAYSTKAGAPMDTNIAGNHITTGRVDANELGVSDEDGANTADFSVKAGEGVKASAGDGNTKGSLDVTAEEVGSTVKDASGKGSTFKQRIDKIMMESKDVSIKAEETLTNEAKVITNKASEVINNEAVNINNTATGIITSKASEIKNQADKLISNKVGENTWENMENGKITTSIKDGAKQNLTQSNAAGTTQSTVDGGKSTVTIQNADGLVDVVTDGRTTSVQNQTASQIAAAVKDGAGNENASVATATNSANTIKSGSKANTVISTADGTSFINSEAEAPVGDGTAVNTTIKGNTITTGKVTMDYAEVMKDLGVHGNAKVDQNLEVGGTSTLKGDVTMESNATVKKDLKVEGTTTTKTLKVTENAEIDGTLKVAKKATFEDSVSIAKDLSVGGDVTAKSYKVGDKTYIDANGINANDQKITNVADGSISEGSKDAVNGGQLYGVKRDLEHQVDKVGANAAAMANLRPMEFDPSSKWNIAAAIGNYGSETAAALGAFYRPNDDVMVNLSTAFGTGENMVGGGVSVRLGKSGNKLSREENNALKAQVDDLTARMDALLSVLNPNMSKDFPDVPENHWAYEAVSRLAGNDIVQGYPDGEFHGERTMTRYEMAEIIYNALSRGAEAERELVEEFKPELQAMAASEKATAEKAEG